MPMTRYFFDLTDNGVHTHDEEGIEFEDVEQAREQAIKSLTEIATDELPNGDRHEFAIEVRCGDNPVLRATLTLRVERLG